MKKLADISLFEVLGCNDQSDVAVFNYNGSTTYKEGKNGRIIVTYSAYRPSYGAMEQGATNGKVISILKPAQWDDWDEDTRYDFLDHFEDYDNGKYGVRTVRRGNKVA